MESVLRRRESYVNSHQDFGLEKSPRGDEIYLYDLNPLFVLKNCLEEGPSFFQFSPSTSSLCFMERIFDI